MTQHLKIDDNSLAYDVTGEGPLVVLAHGMGDSRHSYRFLAPMLVDAGYRVANLDIRGSGDSSPGWDDYSRTAMGGDLVELVRHLGGPAVIIGQSISGGAATVAAAQAPDLVAGLIELAPFTRAQSIPLGAMLTNKRYRSGSLRLMGTMIRGSLSSWKKYLDLAIPVKPADWDAELARIDATLREPGRMKALQAMMKTSPADAGARLAHVACPVLVVQGSLDPDWADPRAEGENIVADLAPGLGELVVLEGVGHYPHTQSPAEVLALALPFLARTLHGA
jgi:pimeloyl-ACP methyl ester carboxylesterase